MSAPKVDLGVMEVWDDYVLITPQTHLYDFSFQAFLWDVAGLLVLCAIQAAAFVCFAYSFAIILKAVLQ